MVTHTGTIGTRSTLLSYTVIGRNIHLAKDYTLYIETGGYTKEFIIRKDDPTTGISNVQSAV